MSILVAPKRAISSLLGAAIIGSALFIAAPALAQAVPVVSVNPNQTTYTDGQTVQVTVTGLKQDTDYRLGLCTVEEFAPTGAPACAESIQVDAQADANGEISASVSLKNNDTNAHGVNNNTPGFPGLPGQPAEVNFSEAGSARITVAEHVDGFGGFPEAYSHAFNVTP